VKPIRQTKRDDLRISIYPTNEDMGLAAAELAYDVLREAASEKGSANLILAAGNSQLTFLAALSRMSHIDWSKVNVFHMDEYIGLEPTHPASFNQFLRRHLIDHITPRGFYPVPAQARDLEAACRDYEATLRAHPADLCAMGIGENGHLAFNDPPFADFNDPVWVKVVKLDEMSRRQQVKEGHFATIDEVPTHAMTLTIPALLAARRALIIVPEARKAEAVSRALNGPISTDCPASILRKVAHAHLLLDRESAGGSLAP
jgi:glucosamine-6-phosphate deaminase